MKLLTNLIFEPKGKHDPALAYNIKDTVMSADGSKVYFALQDVPAGTALNNEDYWKLQIDMHDTLVEMEEATVAAKAAATGAVSTSANQNLSESQKANARQNIGMDKIIESLSDPLNASGNPLVVKPVGGMAFESVVTEFAPKQEGSGEPSPENIRPITGYDAVELNHVGKNRFPVSVLSSTGSGNIYTKDKPFSLRAGQYTLSFKSANATTKDMTLALYSGDTVVKPTQVLAGETRVTFTLDTPADGLLWYVREAVELAEIQLEVGSYASAFEPYQGKLHTVQIGQTVYGGKMDWLTGKLVAEWAMKALVGTETWQMSSYGAYFNTYIADAEKATNTADIKVRSSHFKGVSADDRSISVPIVYFAANSSQVEFRNNGCADVAEWKAYLAAQSTAGMPVQIAYKLATTTTIQLTPSEIIALPGTNTLYGDGDTITVTGRQPKTNALESRLAALEAAMTNV